MGTIWSKFFCAGHHVPFHKVYACIGLIDLDLWD